MIIRTLFNNYPAVWPFLLPLLVGGVIRVGWLQNSFHVIVSDEIAYHELALRLVDWQPYGLPFWPPGWPGVLAILYSAVGVNPQAGLWLNLTLSVLTIALTGGIAWQLFGPQAALGSMWLMALTPSYILPVVLLRYEIWLQFLLALGLWASLWMVAARRWTLVVAAVTVLTTLVRPLWLFLPILLWLCARYLSPMRVRWSHLVVAQLAAILLLIPWLWYASAVAGQFVPVAQNGGINLWIGNNPNATGAYMTPPGEFWDARYDAQARQEAIQYILAHPAQSAGLLGKKVWYSLNREPWVEWVFLKTSLTFAPQVPERWQLVANLVYWPTLLAAVGSVVWLAVAGRWRWLLPWLILLYSIASQLPFFGTPRFRWTTQFVLIVYAAALFPLLQVRWGRWSWRQSTAVLDGLPAEQIQNRPRQ